MKVAIIGAGIAGLATSVRLAAAGNDVEVFDLNGFPGGKLSEFSLGDYRFDFGPSLFTMPMYVDELFEICGENPKQYFDYQRLTTVCNYFWDDKTSLHAFADHTAFANEVEKKLGVEAEVIHKTLQRSEEKYKLTGKIFLENSLHRLKTWIGFDVLWSMLKIPTLGLFTTLNKENQRLTKNPKLVQLLNRFATYNGSNPYQTSGIMSIIPHFEHTIGAFIPKKGMYDITKSIYELALRKGVKFYFNSRVEEIVVEKKQANAIKVGDKKIFFDKIISNCDIFYTYKKLLTTQRQPERILNQPKSTSALIFYWGINRSFSELDLHNIFFSQNYKKEFDALAEGKVGDDVTVYVNITSKYIVGEAPEGCENWFVMVNVPHNSGQNWEEIITRTRQNVIEKISKILNVELEKHIVVEEILDPRTIDSKTHSHLGALYGNSSNNMMAAFLRHANFSSHIKNLYFCGGSVHPGGGIPLCLLSAKIVAENIANEIT